MAKENIQNTLKLQTRTKVVGNVGNVQLHRCFTVLKGERQQERI